MTWRARRDDADLDDTMDWIAEVQNSPDLEFPQAPFDVNEKLSEVASLKFQPSVYAYVRVSAALTGVNVSEWIRQACINRLITEQQLRAAVREDRERHAPAGGDAAP